MEKISKGLVLSLVVALALFSLPLLSATELLGCTLGAVTGNATLSGQDTYVAATSDNPWGLPALPGAEYKPGSINYRTHLVMNATPGHYKFIGTVIGGRPEYGGLAALSRGLNEKGLCFVRGSAGSKETGTPGGLISGNAGYELLMNCATVDEAINFLMTVPKNCSNTYVIGDALGNIARVEVSSKTVVASGKTQNGFTGLTNHFVTPTMYPLNPNPPSGSTVYRYERLMELLATNDTKIDLKVMMSIWRDTKNVDVNGAICAQTPNSGSISHELIEPKKMIFWYSFGIPCPTDENRIRGWDMGKSWGYHLPFSFPRVFAIQPDMGQHDLTTESGELTALGTQCIYVPSEKFPYKPIYKP